MQEKYKEALDSFAKLLEIMDTLREKCPWDRKQTNLSLKPNTIEEVYELAQAIEDNDTEDIKKELGDLLLHIVFYAKIGQEEEKYDIKTVIDSLCEKLIRRHPHIYGERVAETADDVRKTWEQIKLTEGRKGVLSGVPRGLESIIKAYRLQEKAAGVGFEVHGTADQLPMEHQPGHFGLALHLRRRQKGRLHPYWPRQQSCRPPPARSYILHKTALPLFLRVSFLSFFLLLDSFLRICSLLPINASV